MLLNEFAFNEIRDLPDYDAYLCHYASRVHNKASGNYNDKNTWYLEKIFFRLQKKLRPKNLDEVFNYIKEVTEIEIFDGWMSPAFMEIFYYYCEKEDE